MFVLGLAGFFNDFVMPAAWAGCMDVGGRYAGTVSGAMNMFGSMAGASSPLVVGYLLAWTNRELDADVLRVGRRSTASARSAGSFSTRTRRSRRQSWADGRRERRVGD